MKLKVCDFPDEERVKKQLIVARMSSFGSYPVLTSVFVSSKNGVSNIVEPV